MAIKWNPSSRFWRLGMYTSILVEYRIFRDPIKYIYIYIYIFEKQKYQAGSKIEMKTNS